MSAFVPHPQDKHGNYVKLGGVNVAGLLNPLEHGNNHKPKLVVKDQGNGQYDISFVIEKVGPYEIALTGNNRPLGKSKVTCIPAEACGKNSVASGAGIRAATIGQPNQFVVQARDRFDNDVKVCLDCSSFFCFVFVIVCDVSVLFFVSFRFFGLFHFIFC
jgi:hypothetical protein